MQFITSQKNKVVWFSLLQFSSLFYDYANHIHHLNLVIKEEPCV